MRFFLKKILILIPFSLLNSGIFGYSYTAQDKQYPSLKIIITEDGLYKIMGKDIKKISGIKEINPSNLQLTNQGKEVPIYISGEENGRLDDKDYILFLGRKNTSKFSKFNIYWLKVDGDIKGKRVGEDFLIQKLKTEVQPSLRLEENIIYDPLPEYYRSYYLKFKKFPEHPKDHWFWKKIFPAEEFAVKFNIQDLTKEDFQLKISLQSRGDRLANCGCRVSLNGKLLGVESFGGEKILNFNLNKSAFKWGKNVLKIKNVSQKIFYLDWIELDIPDSKFQIPDPRFPPYIVLDNPSSLKQSQNSADYLIITLSKYKMAILPLAIFRQSQGYKVKIVDVEDVYDEFNFGNFSPEALKEFIRWIYDNWQIKPYYILLVGDATVDVHKNFPPEVLPTYTLPTLLGGETASDNYFADLNDDAIPDLAIGRLPVQNDRELKLIIRKIINYETSAPFGLWKTNFCLTAGDDPSYAEIFPVMEKAYVKMIKMYLPYEYYVYGLIGMEGSIYNYIPSKYPEAVIERINKGCLVWNYIGHGLNYGFGPIYRGDKTYPLFNMEHLFKLKTNNRPPLILSICCLTGAFDYPGKDCLAERWLKTKDGAIAVFAASRISDPYGNALLQKELIYHIFQKKSTLGEALVRVKKGLIEREDYFRKTIDSIAKIAFKNIEELNLELPPDYIDEYLPLSRDYHLHMYNLLGDPALRLAMPKDEIKISLNKNRFKPGDKIEIRLNLKNISRGKLWVRLECERDMVLFPEDAESFKDKNHEIIKSNYVKANNKVVEERLIDLSEKSKKMQFILPSNLPAGKYYIRVYAHNDTTDAVGAYRIWVVEGS